MDIQQATIEQVHRLSSQIFEHPQPPSAYQERLQGVAHLILLATIDDKPVGFKVGYDRDGYWYSWFGGVHPDYRRQGVASALADAQDEWAQAQGYPHVTCKTRNHRRAMLHWCLKRGFRIIEVKPRQTVDEYRIVLRKFYS